MSQENGLPLVAGIGELLWDLFPDRRRPGGAPANVAFHARQLGLQAAIWSRVGNDDLGSELLTMLESRGLSSATIQRDNNHPTGQVRVLDADTDHPGYRIEENAAWDFLEFDDGAQQLATNTDAVVFGTLAQRHVVSRSAIAQFLLATAPHCLKILDINLREPWYSASIVRTSLTLADVAKLNREEIGWMQRIMGWPGDEPGELAARMVQTFELRLACVTGGSEGCWLADGQTTIHSPGVTVQQADPVGAGDAFTAALLFATLKNWPLQRRGDFANRTGALVASQPGAMPVLTDEFAALIGEFSAA